MAKGLTKSQSAAEIAEKNNLSKKQRLKFGNRLCNSLTRTRRTLHFSGPRQIGVGEP